MSNKITCTVWCFVTFVLAFSFSPTSVNAEISNTQSGSKITRANFDLAKDWSVEKQFEYTKDLWIVPYWASDEDLFAYCYTGQNEVDYYLVDPSKKQKRELFDRRKIAGQLRQFTDIKYDWKRLPIRLLELNSEGNSLVFLVDEQKYCYDLTSEELRLLDTVPQSMPPDLISTSPDGQVEIYFRDHNLYLREIKTNSDSLIQLTFDGSENNDIYEILWSPDARHFSILREDWTKVEDLWLINPLSNPRPALETFKWPAPGENVEQYSLYSYNCQSGTLITIATERWVDQTLFQIEWSHDSRKLYFQRLSRDWHKLDLCVANPNTGNTKTLIEERDLRQYYYSIRHAYRILESTNEIIWWSWKENWGHYYLYNENGELQRKLTSGSFNSGRIVHIDEQNRILYFMGNGRERGRNPYNHYFYRVKLDGSGLQLLTPEDAEHTIYTSKSGEYFVDSYSRPDLQPCAVLRNNNGDLIMELESADISALVNAGWCKPEIFAALAADDSTELWGVIYKPFDLDSTKKYPVIVYGYPGKESEFIPLKFCNNNWITVVSTALAQYGFVVAVYGNRGGTIERSYDYYNFGWDNLRDYPLADKKHVMMQLAERYKYIDIDRIGIMGSSSGGFLAAAAILSEPDFFKVAVAKSGNHDNNVYYHHWNERYGIVRESLDDDGQVTFESQSPSNNEIAGNLKGRLLLVHGDMDHYVPPSQTSRLAYSLIEANKRFDQFIVPGGDHFFGNNWQYLIRYIELYFVEHLMGDDRWSVDIFDEPDSIFRK